MKEGDVTRGTGETFNTPDCEECCDPSAWMCARVERGEIVIDDNECCTCEACHGDGGARYMERLRLQEKRNAAARVSRTKCTEACWARPTCTTCGKRKAPRGRSVPLPMAGGLCDWECSGYNAEPLPGHYWPGEEPWGLFEEDTRPAPEESKG